MIFTINYTIPAHPENQYNLLWGYDGYALRTCGAMPTISVQDRRECGQGLIIRDVRVTYVDPKTGASVVFRDRQEIWVIDCDPFYVTEDCFDNDDCIDWPLFCQQPDPIEGCGADTDPYNNPNLGFPEVVNGCDDNCALVAIEHQDEIYSVEDTACFKILRTWVVIDWCQYDPLAPETRDGDNPNQVSDGRWEFLQVILVRDTDDPIITIEDPRCDTLRGGYDSTLMTCTSHITMCASANDNCSPDDWLVYEYKLDLYSDSVGAFGYYDHYAGKLTWKQYNSLIRLSNEDCQFHDNDGYCNPYADEPDQPFCLTGTYPKGIHTVYWFVEDGCGNYTKEVKVFEVRECKAPTPYCKTGIITVPMPSNLEIDIWARDLDDGSFDNCTSNEDLIFSFSSDTSDTYMTLTCDDLGEIEVEIWVTDECGNQDFCRTTIDLQDNDDRCGTNGSIVGTVENVLMQEKVENVNIDLNDKFVTKTNDEGAFLVSAINGDVITPNKNDDPENGVSTADLVAIQRHLLGKKEFDLPHQYIAADVNNNEGVSAADISSLRKFILGYVTDFSQWNDQQSWRFMPTDYDFGTNVSEPWGYPEEIKIKPGPVRNINFHAVKIGDLNGDADNNLNGSNQSRSGSGLVLNAQDAWISPGQIATIEITSANFIEISGFQMTLKLNSSLEFVNIESGRLHVAGNNIGVSQIDHGMVTMSWSDVAGNALTFGEDEVLFSLILKADRVVSLSSVLSITSDITKAEAYDIDLGEMPLSLEFNEGESRYELYQNVPNPFKNSTMIAFELPISTPVVITIYDVSGRVLTIRNIEGQIGRNEIEIERDDLLGAGVLYYQLDAMDYTATKRMILVE